MSRRHVAALALVAALGSGAAGCYKATFHLQPGAGTRSAHVDDELHFSVINVVEVSGPVRLDTACDGGTAVSASERVGPLGAVVNLLLAWAVPIFSVMNPSVDCAAAGTPAAPAASAEGQ